MRSEPKMKPVQSVATYVALLRGINVGGKNKLPMKDLAEMFVMERCQNVRTFIQSGNVIFTARSEISKKLADRVIEQIAKRYGYRTAVILRTAAELHKLVSKNPFMKGGLPDRDLHILFLADIPKSSASETLDPDRSPPDEFVLHGREIYLRLPNGAGITKLTNAYFDSKLATTSTGRNWRTVTKLLELAAGNRDTRFRTSDEHI
jgi:uncharacterized protein (DUF1697 family)